MSNSNQQLFAVHSSNSSSCASLLYISLTSTSNSCPRCSDKLHLPPSIKALTSVFPSITPSNLNRSIPRCVQCDRVNAEKAAYFAEFPPPTDVNPVAELERDILRIKDTIASNIEAEGMKIALAEARERKANKEAERDAGIKEAWKDFIGIWGRPRNRIGGA